MSRYDDREILINNESIYKTIFKNRGVSYIKQYATPTMRYPSVDEMLELSIVGYTWGLGDRYYKLADKYYGDPTRWWIIAWYNQKPTEAHIKNGDTILIPLPLDKILRFLDV